MNIKRIIFLIALRREWLSFYKSHSKTLFLLLSDKDQFLYRYKKSQVFIFQTGTGPLLNYNILEQYFTSLENSVLINIGYAGILDRFNFKIGDIIYPKYIIDKKKKNKFKNYQIKILHKNILYCNSLCTFDTTFIKEKELINHSDLMDISIVDMEAFLHAKYFKNKNIRFITIKIGSDYCEPDTLKTIKKNNNILQNKINILINIFLNKEIKDENFNY